MGCEYYVIDAGWYAPGEWWDSVGEWQQCYERFPNGIEEVTNYIREKGMVPGVWLELEVMGINYWVLLLARFISGLPHGAYFGVASIVAEKLADKGKGSEAVSIMIAGMTIANLFGVPLGTSLSNSISWRVTFLLVGCWGPNDFLPIGT